MSELDFAPLDEGVQEFSQAAEEFAALWIECADGHQRVMPKQGVDQGMVRQALLHLLRAAHRLLGAIERMPPKVREDLEQVPPPPGGVWLYYPPEPLPKRAQEAIAFGKRWFRKLAEPNFWAKADWEYDFFVYVGDLLGIVWDGLPKTLQRYEWLKQTVEEDSLLGRADLWLESNGTRKRDGGPSPASGEQAGGGNTPPEVAGDESTAEVPTASPLSPTKRKRGPKPLDDRQAAVYRDIAKAWNRWSACQNRATYIDFAEAYRDDFAERYQSAFPGKQWGSKAVRRAVDYAAKNPRK